MILQAERMLLTASLPTTLLLSGSHAAASNPCYGQSWNHHLVPLIQMFLCKLLNICRGHGNTPLPAGNETTVRIWSLLREQDGVSVLWLVTAGINGEGVGFYFLLSSWRIRHQMCLFDLHNVSSDWPESVSMRSFQGVMLPKQLQWRRILIVFVFFSSHFVLIYFYKLTHSIKPCCCCSVEPNRIFGKSVTSFGNLRFWSADDGNADSMKFETRRGGCRRSWRPSNNMCTVN